MPEEYNYTKQEYTDEKYALIDFLAKNIVHFSDNAKSIKDYTFWNNNNLNSITLTDATSIGGNCNFFNCQNLTKIDLHKKVDFYSIPNSNKNFNNCPSLIHLILRSPTKCTISSSGSTATTYIKNIFKGSPIHYGHGAIYVPSNLINQYKNDNNWKQYVIYPIPSQGQSLSTIFETLTGSENSWTNIIHDCLEGNIDRFNIGDTKSFKMNNVTYYAELVGKNVDYISNQQQTLTAPTSWIVKELYPQTSIMTDNNSKIWDTSNIKTILNTIYNNYLPADLKEGIKEVEKITYNGSSSSTTNEFLWIPSYKEIFGGDTYEKTGADYSNWFKEQDKDYRRIKYITVNSNNSSITQGNSYQYWLRTKVDTSSFATITDVGGAQPLPRNNARPFCFGFCI